MAGAVLVALLMLTVHALGKGCLTPAVYIPMVDLHANLL